MNGLKRKRPFRACSPWSLQSELYLSRLKVASLPKQQHSPTLTMNSQLLLLNHDLDSASRINGNLLLGIDTRSDVARTLAACTGRRHSSACVRWGVSETSKPRAKCLVIQAAHAAKHSQREVTPNTHLHSSNPANLSTKRAVSERQVSMAGFLFASPCFLSNAAA